MSKFISLLNEISQETAQRLPVDPEDNLDYIFGDNLRIAEKVSTASKFTVPIQDILDDFDIDFQEWKAYRKNDVDKKNPTKVNKALFKQMKTLEKSGGDEQSITKIQNLLNVYDLKAQAQAVETPLYVIFSRSPLDVVRMSDHKRMSSCHSEGGDYFACALADAMNNAGVAYLVTEEVFGLIDDLQADEIFEDGDRGTGTNGVAPLARIRLRKIVDEQREQQVVPSLKLYGNQDYQDVFKGHVTNWAKKKINPKFNWEGILTLKGGSYEDAGVGVVTMAEKIFGKNIHTRTAYDEGEFEGEFGSNDDEYREQYWDEFKEQAERKFDKIDLSFLEFNHLDFQAQTVDVTLDFDDYNKDIFGHLNNHQKVEITKEEFKDYFGEVLNKFASNGVNSIIIWGNSIELEFDYSLFADHHNHFEYYDQDYVESNPTDFIDEIKEHVEKTLADFIEPDSGEIYIEDLFNKIYYPVFSKQGIDLDKESIQKYFKLSDDYELHTNQHHTDMYHIQIKEKDLKAKINKSLWSRIANHTTIKDKEAIKEKFFTTTNEVGRATSINLRPEIQQELNKTFKERRGGKVVSEILGAIVKYYREEINDLSPAEATLLTKNLGKEISLPSDSGVEGLGSFTIDFADILTVKARYSDEELKVNELLFDLSEYNWEEEIKDLFWKRYQSFALEFFDNKLAGDDPNQMKFGFHDEVKECKSFSALINLIEEHLSK